MSKAKKSTVDDITRKKLLYAKQFYLHGEKHARQQNPIDRMIAIHHFHIAIEIALKASYTIHFPDKDLMQIRFPELKSGLKETYPWLEDFNVFLNKLNKTRNRTQHEAEVVAPEDIPDYQMKTWNFLSEFFRRVFEVSFEELDLADRIEDEKLRQVLLWARELIEQGEYEKSVAYSKGAYDIALKAFDSGVRRLEQLKTQITSRLRLDEAGRYVAVFNRKEQSSIRALKNDFVKSHGETVRAFEKLIEEISELYKSSLSIGDLGNWQEQQRFKDTYPEVEWMQSAQLRYFPTRREEGTTSLEDANWVREYVIGAIIDWQERGFEPKWDDFYLQCFEWVKNQIEAKGKETSK